MSDRASCWSITINNPTEDEVRCTIPGWKLEGQYEVGKEGTRHFQGMLTTNQQRFTAVKRQFPRAHIEIARDKKALQQYVHKPDTKVSEFTPQAGLTIFTAQKKVCEAWDHETWVGWQEHNRERGLMNMKPDGDVALEYVDEIVGRLIREGACGLEFIGINPMWRSSWKKFYADIITRHATCPQSSPQASSPSSPPSQDAAI